MLFWYKMGDHEALELREGQRSTKLNMLLETVQGRKRMLKLNHPWEIPRSLRP